MDSTPRRCRGSERLNWASGTDRARITPTRTHDAPTVEPLDSNAAHRPPAQPQARYNANSTSWLQPSASDTSEPTASNVSMLPMMCGKFAWASW